MGSNRDIGEYTKDCLADINRSRNLRRFPQRPEPIRMRDLRKSCPSDAYRWIFSVDGVI
jgi:hypothetical protein